MDLIWDKMVEAFRILGSAGRDLERFGRPLFVPAGKQEADPGRP